MDKRSNLREWTNMKQKDMYTLDELCDNLTISLSEFSEMSGVNEGTLARIRKGYSARRKTVNRLLAAFSEVHGIELSLDNVTGITLEDKKAIRQQALARKGIAEKVEKPPAPSPVVQSKPVAEKPQKRVYNRKEKDTGLPAGAMLATDFAKAHGRNDRSFRDDMLVGLGPGLIHGPDVDEDGIYAIKDYVQSEERPKPNRPNEKERYLTNDQQKAAIQFWQRHDVAFTQCESTPCWCHTFLEETE